MHMQLDFSNPPPYKDLMPEWKSQVTIFFQDLQSTVSGHPAPQKDFFDKWLNSLEGLKGTIPDEGVIVLAQINEEGTLSEVSGIEAKTKAIANAKDEEGHSRFDTIVVASENNLEDAVKALRKLGFDMGDVVEEQFDGQKRRISHNNQIRVVLPLG